MCVCVQFDFSKQFQIDQEDLRVTSALQSLDLKRGVYRKTASLRGYRIRVAAVLAHRSAILLALAGTRVHIHSRGVALDHVVFLYRLCHCVWPWFGATLNSARAYLHHWALTSTTCNRSPE